MDLDGKPSWHRDPRCRVDGLGLCDCSHDTADLGDVRAGLTESLVSGITPLPLSADPWQPGGIWWWGPPTCPIPVPENAAQFVPSSFTRSMPQHGCFKT